MNKKIIIFGHSQIAELAWYYFTHDSEYEVSAFTVDAAYLSNHNFCHLPVVAFDNIEEIYPSNQYEIFIALAYSNLNQLRKQKYLESKAKGYRCVTYISSKATVLINHTQIGENCFILEDNTIQPFTNIGHNVTLWSGNHIGHHSKIGDHCFISSHVVVSGGVIIEDECFLGVNATLRNGITIGKSSVIGAGSWINKNVEPQSIYSTPPAEKSKLQSSQLKRL